MNSAELLELPHYDGRGKRVYWVFLQERDDKDPVKGHIALAEREQPFGSWIYDRPGFMDLGVNRFVLTNEVHEWLWGNNFDYTLEYRWHGSRVGWHIGLPDKSSATLFKLSWGS